MQEYAKTDKENVALEAIENYSSLALNRNYNPFRPNSISSSFKLRLPHGAECFSFEEIYFGSERDKIHNAQGAAAAARLVLYVQGPAPQPTRTLTVTRCTIIYQYSELRAARAAREELYTQCGRLTSVTYTLKVSGAVVRRDVALSQHRADIAR
ncbi:hypothetical protein EVAR_21205_1 [Eumeta japonica]|uniref:Uncharacterized protein n=1 Tax=Eumeta variegata TaxID=151549 RepID=A0A4C1UNR8_EUMVA|nr:hypothetical protein EVAR_21205_1 [Eumeta japonica]